MFCRNCGKELPYNSVFCPSCGIKIPVATAIPSPEPVESAGSGAAPLHEAQSEPVVSEVAPSAFESLKFVHADAYFNSQSSSNIQEMKELSSVNSNTVISNPAGEYPMKWYYFTIYFLLFALALFRLVDGIIVFKNAEMLTYSYKTFTQLIGVLEILTVPLLIIARQKLAKFKHDGPMFLYISVIAGNACSVIYALYMEAAIESLNYMSYFASYGAYDGPYYEFSSLPTILGAVAGTFFWIVINKIYFDRRKDLFVN